MKPEKKISIVPNLSLTYLEPETIILKNNTSYDEKWLQDKIAENPKILGLGDVETLDRERRQPKAGRLDLLLQEIEGNKRYTVELQLGSIDESHLIRTIEYWDIERKRYPHYDHTAVIVAEEITGRFLNVISLFNGHIPLIAIQIKTVRMGENIGLIFTKVLDEVELGIEEDEARENVETNREYWENRSSPEMLGYVDHLHKLVTGFAPDYDLKYNKFYIGLSKRGKVQNFVAFKPQKNAIRIEIGMEISKENIEKLESAGLEVNAYVPHWKQQSFKVQAKDISTHAELITQVMLDSFNYYFS